MGFRSSLLTLVFVSLALLSCAIPNHPTLTIEIGPNDLARFIDGHFDLYVTRSVVFDGEEQDGNIIFSMIPSNKLVPTQNLTWGESYEVFQKALQSTAGDVVEFSTQNVRIEGGETATFNESGIATVTGPAEPGTAFAVVNHWKQWASVWVSNYDPLFKTYSAIYVSDTKPESAKSGLLPLKRFNVFWGRYYTIGGGIDPIHTPAYLVDLTDRNRTIRYQDGQWKDV